MTKKDKDPAKTSFQLMPVSAFETLDKGLNILDKRKVKSSEERSELYADYAKKHLHKGAHNVYRKLARMEPGPLSLFLAHLDHYRALGELDKKAGLQGTFEPVKEADKDVRPRHLRERDAERAVETAGRPESVN